MLSTTTSQSKISTTKTSMTSRKEVLSESQKRMFVLGMYDVLSKGSKAPKPRHS